MVLLYHNHNKVVKVISKGNAILSFDKKATIATVLLDLAIQNPQSKIIWCHENHQEFLNLDAIDSVFHHNKMMLSYNPNEISFLGKKIGYIDESPFIKINKKVTYPTWIMSGLVGVIHATVLLEVKNKIKPDSDFDYYLSSIAKVCMPLGLLCYSEPKLLATNNINATVKPSNFTLFKFVKQHYRTRWIFLLFLNLMVYEFKFPVLASIYSLFFKNRNNNTIKLDKIEVNASTKAIDSQTVDILIPTIGRKKYLYDVLVDLSKQTHLPKNVIIVEQNPDLQSTSELDYLVSENWPFKIKHTFINQTGACNARNVALDQVESEWIFFADDDIRFNENFIESAIDLISQYKCKAVTFRCFQENEKQTIKEIFQWSAFGSGCSFVKSEAVKNVQFDLRYEFGFGEDTDFGMQIRNSGCDVLYFPTPEILHLKAPIGGFRTKPSLLWSNDEIKPKPSPTITLYKLLHETKEQHNGYKTILFFKYYRNQSVKNPIKYYFKFQKEWKRSLYWANELINKA
ncbi:glycosyltransferase family 2 protein [Flavobacterium sp. ANB]|uniref:glycosyltransferase family 2 protein n=1 Tax=unclassified Flavobacterium TaxID=196869 RepID=UPI0012B6C913|nr:MULTISPECIES: glycosyltransferase family A protein [unclassified Flavobacterium]MBF4517572.1 glycosyltransferase family 2 protein [Flavobacterium sp. ANB]MTD70299.1 glycosyltransferase [Flavobacterium sp. LC2016-13]